MLKKSVLKEAAFSVLKNCFKDISSYPFGR
jgi:hypothetical protein